MEISPGRTKYWVPNCEGASVPHVGLKFKSLEEGVQLYRSYAALSGFDARQSTAKRNREGEITTKYLVCSREGYKGGGVKKHKNGEGEDGGGLIQRRRRPSNRVGCGAKIGFRKINTGEFLVSIFENKHNHYLTTDASKVFLRANRKLDIWQQTLIANCAKANIGPTRTFRLCKEVAGGYDNVGATSMEFCNFKRDLQAYIEGGDAQIVIEKLRNKKELNADFFYNYYLDEENRLARLFWSDPISRQNYMRFGDVVSFDATYGTNKYNLVFVPFTGVDNHKRCVTFAAGLLTKEDIDSYTWLLDNFKAAMGNPPLYIVTDQDPAMRTAIPKVFNECRHRFCMWHIMTKVSEKVGPELAKDEVFRKKLNKIVWNEVISVEDFEAQWKTLMEEYKLANNQWLCHLFELRKFWIPAYFGDVFMGGLIRTTSRSEADNSAFGKFTSPNASLVEFYFQYESAIDAQRHSDAKRNAQCEGYFPDYETPLLLERHAATVYTIMIFYEVQKEIIAGCFYCQIVEIRKDGDSTWYDIKEECNRIFCVKHSPADNSVLCSCGLFNRLGMVCRHMFLVFKDARLECIPNQYVVPRWTKLSCMEHLTTREQHTSRDSFTKLLMKKMWSDIYSCIGLVGGDSDRLERMTQVIKGLKEEFTQDGATQELAKGNKGVIEAFCETRAPDIVTIKPPLKVKNKGSGRRIKSNREKGIEKSKKPKRLCRSCNQFARHDSRNCPTG
ncbi:protein FAR1-RELATED SEQUENCE 5-like [Ipomoea triloba]|uniref:protein FAR1-RELATED SEQUENCE 5-like n=1 Tax=Ipomoea triloba TaxID=35885 RepID=UPI00125E0664|nr:protein FAR1-RELATED SEQUENCE 5-like [Ipomoea triloba]